MSYLDDHLLVVVIHRVCCRGSDTSSHHQGHESEAFYRDTPRLFRGDNKKSILRGKVDAPSVQSYLSNHFGPIYDEDDSDTTRHHVMAVVERSYDCTEYHDAMKEAFAPADFVSDTKHLDRRLRPYLLVLQVDGPEAICHTERMTIANSILLASLQRLPGLEREGCVKLRFPEVLEAPYLPFYFFRDHIKRQIAELDDQHLRKQLVVLMQYILEVCKDDFEEADALFAKDLVTREHFPKMFSPFDVVVSHEAGHCLAYLNVTLLSKETYSCRLSCWSWSFDGKFRRTPNSLQARWSNTSDDAIPISSLAIYPLKFALQETRDMLSRRGKRIWGCRKKSYVSYRAPNLNFDAQMANPRFMVDVHTYKDLHSEGDEIKHDNDDDDDDDGVLDKMEFDKDEHPGGDFLLLLPDTVVGYGFHDKKWKTLQAEHITDIEWQSQAFGRLVLDQNKKDIIEALVSVHVSTVLTAEPGDIIQGKGNGLILLLHGSPGTGKTLTAESIAELTQKPLYRVTCGDVGVEPETVEKYLDSVLYIGSVWGCIVLLDEADIFLEERTQADLQRNALVSVFLRVLEYYNGILILTTNRVGIFDEAFKSRIQLSIHYPPLDEVGRLEIWLNFFATMNDESETLLAELRSKAYLLARYPINGRQIRNTVKSAKQLAHHKKERLSYLHFDKIIRIADEFDRYIENVHGGNTDEEWARGLQNRA